MSKPDENRVLGRVCARELTQQEREQVSGGIITSILTRFPAADVHTDG
ncbi:MAG TPA: hypothetical protein VF532_12890 [Candidatus Angelobacter sp.]